MVKLRGINLSAPRLVEIISSPLDRHVGFSDDLNYKQALYQNTDGLDCGSSMETACPQMIYEAL